MRYHLHAELIHAISTISENSPHPIHFYKVKAHSGIVGNEGADACARNAALSDNIDVVFPDARDPFHNIYWLSLKTSSLRDDGIHRSHAFPMHYLTNLNDKLKAHMHKKHKLGSADTSGHHYHRWQKLNDAIPPTTIANTESRNPTSQLANKEISNSFWKNLGITFKQQINIMKYRTDTLYNQSHAFKFNSSNNGRCPLCDDLDHIDHILLRCTNSTMRGMHTNRHNAALSLCVKALSKGRYGSSLIGMDGCSNEKLLDQGLQVPENISRAIPDWVFPNGTGSPARHQTRPDAIFVRPLPGRQTHLDPSKIPPQDRDIHLVELKFCPDTNPFITLERAVTQHSHTITRLKTRSSRNPNRNNKVTLHIILIGVAGTIYNEYTITPLINLGLTKQKAKSLAAKLRDHAIQRLTTIKNTRHALCFQGVSGRGSAGRAAAEDGRRRVRASRGMASSNPPDPH
jgi:hypothetical protein